MTQSARQMRSAYRPGVSVCVTVFLIGLAGPEGVLTRRGGRRGT